MWRRVSLFLGRLLLCVVAILIVVDAWVAYSQPMYYAESVWEVEITESYRNPTTTPDWHSRATRRTYAQLVTRPSGIERAADRLGYTSEQLDHNKVTIDTREKDNGTYLQVFVRVGSKTPALSAHMADMLPTVLIEEIEEVRAEDYSHGMASLDQQLEILESQIEQTNSEIESYLALGDDITPQESVELVRLQIVLAHGEKNTQDLAQRYEQIRLAKIRNSEIARLVKVATIPTSPRQSIFFDLFNSAIHMQLADRFIR